MHDGEHMACPICSHTGSMDFFDAPAIPVTCASIFRTRAEALAVPRGALTLTTCNACSFVYNRVFNPSLGEIGARYESSQAASVHFGTYADGLAHEWIERYELTGKTVLEVGCGNGDFLLRLLQGGVATAVGIDPFVDPSRRAAGLRLVADSFDERWLDQSADALVCRHTLEHIQSTSSFLRLLRNWAARDRRRVLLFELPAAERVFAERAFWDVYYEHCNYFTSDTLRYAFELAGFEVLALRQVYGEQYLIIEARAGASVAPKRPDVEAAQEAYRSYGVEVRASIERCQRALDHLKREAAPLMLWQGASKTVGFTALLRDPSVISGAVDLSPQRHGKFLPGSGMSVHAPAELQRLRPGNIVLMNPLYLGEVTAQVRGLGLNTPVHSVNSLL
jgi:SAM-dependent methyltransferase